MEDDLQRQIDDLKQEVEDMKPGLVSRFMDPVVKDEFFELTADRVLDILWDKVFFVSSMNGPAVTTTSASEKFDINTREADTSGQKYLSIDSSARFRCHFYFTGTDSFDSTTYIGSHGASTLDSGITSINQEEMQYLALKIDASKLSIVGKNFGGTTQKDLNITIEDDSTHTLEINYFPKERADFLLDNETIGSITESLPSNLDILTVFPLLVSITRIGSINRSVTVESWEYIQERNRI